MDPLLIFFVLFFGSIFLMMAVCSLLPRDGRRLSEEEKGEEE